MKTQYSSVWILLFLTMGIVLQASDTPPPHLQKNHRRARKQRKASLKEASTQTPDARGEATRVAADKPDTDLKDPDRDRPRRVGVEPTANEDPDLPPGMQRRIDKADYLRRRAEMINRLRGFPNSLPYNPASLTMVIYPGPRPPASGCHGVPRNGSLPSSSRTAVPR
jgi:hypothetical protein